jgi:LacI family transcriptional regulator
MTTAKDVAASLGLSVSTVGRALSDDPRISAETKARVVRAAEAMGCVAAEPAPFASTSPGTLTVRGSTGPPR